MTAHNWSDSLIQCYLQAFVAWCFSNGFSHALCFQGRNRRCITVDMRQEEGRDIIRQLANNVDVLVENFRPGVMEKWKLGPKVDVFSCSLWTMKTLQHACPVHHAVWAL